MTSPQHDFFDAATAYWRFMGRWSRQVAPLLASFARVRDGDAILDVGSGTGALSAALADAFPSVRVTGVDPSRAYVGYAQGQSPDDRLQFVVGDAQALEFPDATFDKALSLLCLNFVAAPERAVREMIRVTRRGGVVAAAVWDYGEGMEMLRVFWDEAVALDPAIASRDERRMPLCREGELAELWRSAGLEAVDQQPLVTTLHFTSFDDYWQPFLGGQGPAGAYTAALSADRQAQLRSRIRDRLLPAADGPFILRARAWAAKGQIRPNS